MKGKNILNWFGRQLTDFSLPSPGTETEEGAAGLYRREGELEADKEARKGRDDGNGNDSETDPEGMSDDDFMGATMEDKETQTGNLSMERKPADTRSVASQTGRRLKQVSSDDPRMIKSGQYLAIRAGRKAADNTQAIGNMGHGECVRVKVEEGGLCNPSDLRIKKTVMRYRTDDIMTVSCSFEPATMICSNCQERGKHSVLNSRDGGPVVFLGTDQNFPAVLPSLDHDNCMSIIRVEDGTIREITWAVIDILKGIRLPNKTTILLGSVSSLAARGVQAYGEDLIWGIRQLREKLGEGVTVSALPPIPVNGVNNSRLVRNLAEVEIWFEGIKPDGVLLKRTRCFLLTEMERCSLGRVIAPEEQMVTMPDSIDDFNKVPTALMGWKGMGEQISPFPQELEAMQVRIMREELEVNFGVTVTKNFDLRRNVEVGEPAEYVVIGGSHGGYLCEAISRKGRKAIDLTEKGMRITAETVAKLETRLAEDEGEDESEGDEMMREKVRDDMVVVLWVMDNSLYFAEDEEGARNLPKRSEDGKYHFEGQVKLASGKQAVKAMERFLPVLRRLKKNRKLIMVPTPRCVCKACCLDKNHCVNRREEGFLSGILEGIKEIRRALRDSCHEWRISNYKVVNGCTLLGLQEESSFHEWEEAMGQDSVHLTEAGYGKMAEEIFQMSEGFEAVFSGGKREREEEEERPDPIISGRKPWVYGGMSGQGRGGGGRGGRGGRGAPRGGRGGYKPGSHAGGYGFSPAGSYSGYVANKR